MTNSVDYASFLNNWDTLEDQTDWRKKMVLNKAAKEHREHKISYMKQVCGDDRLSWPWKDVQDVEKAFCSGVVYITL